MNLKKPQFWLLIFAVIFFILTPVFHYQLDRGNPLISQLDGYGKGTALGLSVLFVLISVSLSINDKSKGTGMTDTDYLNMSICISDLLIFIAIAVVHKIESPWLLGLALYGALASASQLIEGDVK
jgi:hypothetical protein